MLYPLKLSAPLKDYLWGGNRLKEEYGKQTQLPCVAESWELSCHRDGTSVIENGEAKGMLLTDYLREQGKQLLGSNAQRFSEFPILIKLIDAAQNLSVQVHPDAAHARPEAGEASKTEMWYVVDCEEGASLIYGFDHEISREEFARRIQDNTLLEVVRQVPVERGDVFFIEAGTLHAIGKGILIAEIQQNSNTTYRVYDYGRVGADGKPRELHIDRAVEVTGLKPVERKPGAAQGEPRQEEGYLDTLLASCDYFTVHRLELQTGARLEADAASFHSLLALAGETELNTPAMSLILRPGDSVFLPAGMGEYRLEGSGTILLTTV